MGRKAKKVAVTGAAGQIAYSLLFRLAKGELFGKEQPIELQLLETSRSIRALEGVVMELNDCAYPLVEAIHIGSDPNTVLEGVEVAFLVGSMPRGPGMERKDLLDKNAAIFVEQGKALNQVAADDVFVLVVGNPCNTNCLITMHHAPRLKAHQFCAMMRLDQNRAAFQLASKARVPIQAVDRMVVWGNHSATQVPDFASARIFDKPFLEVVDDRDWCENVFMQSVQKRGAEIIQARGHSSAASAANAALSAALAYFGRDASQKWHSQAVLSDGNPYGIAAGLVFSFPTLAKGEVVKGVDLDPFIEEKILLTEQELLKERDLVKYYLS